ncbi:MAG: methyltransferase [Chitinophagales bacterium]
MININSKRHKEGNEALRIAVEENSFEDWISYVNDSLHDGFLNIFASKYGLKALNSVGYGNLKDFFLDIDNFKKTSTNPNHEMDKIGMVLYYAWEALSKNITHHISNSRNIMNIPASGGLLIYVAGMHFCIISRFHRYKTGLEVIDAIDEPQSVFDFWGSINQAGMSSRNMLKEILSTGHKLIYHRGILIHVDKRKDVQVFGPSIDTILMNEVLCQYYFEEEKTNSKATEIGCGNGLLSISTVKNQNGLDQLDIVDVNFNAIYCTHKNLYSNLTKHQIDNKTISFICGKFSTQVLKCKYDLAICNPPYIPLPKSNRKTDVSQDYYTAVGGLEVIDT